MMTSRTNPNTGARRLQRWARQTPRPCTREPVPAATCMLSAAKRRHARRLAGAPRACACACCIIARAPVPACFRTFSLLTLPLLTFPPLKCPRFAFFFLILSSLPLHPGSKYYERLKELRQYHQRFPVYDVTGAEDDAALLKEEPRLEFSGEEGLGRCVAGGAAMRGAGAARRAVCVACVLSGVPARTQSLTQSLTPACSLFSTLSLAPAAALVPHCARPQVPGPARAPPRVFKRQVWAPAGLPGVPAEPGGV